MAVQLELPVRPGREPVVVVAVQDDRRVRADARFGQQRAEVLAAGDVAADPVGQLARPVPADGARQVALLVGGRVDVDLDEADVRVGQVGLAPSRCRRGRSRWRSRGGSWRWSSVGPVVAVGVELSSGRSDWSLGSRRGVSRPRWSVAAAELGQPLGTRGRLARGLADDPRVDPARVLDGRSSARAGRPRRRSPSCCGSRPSSSPGAGGRRRRRPGR